jgi:hypothetical protein
MYLVQTEAYLIVSVIIQVHLVIYVDKSKLEQSNIAGTD